MRYCGFNCNTKLSKIADRKKYEYYNENESDEKID